MKGTTKRERDNKRNKLRKVKATTEIGICIEIIEKCLLSGDIVGLALKDRGWEIQTATAVHRSCGDHAFWIRQSH